MNYGYVRVSSDKQTVDNQKFEIARFCGMDGISIDGWIEETISGTINYEYRKLGRLLGRLKPGDLIICTEISRLGRTIFMIMDVLYLCMKKDCKIWTVKEGYRLGDDLQSKVLAFAFSLSAEIERQLISERTKEALARRKAEGMILGRPHGSKTAPEKMKLFHKRRFIVEELSKGNTITSIARSCKVSRTTIYSYIRNYIGSDILSC